MWFLNTLQTMCSHNSNLVSNVKSVLLSWENDVGFLESVWSDQGVDWLDLDVIKILTSFLDHWLVSSAVNDENQGVVVFNGLDCAFSGEWVLNDGILIPGLFLLYDLSLILGSSGFLKGLGSSECDWAPDFVFSLTVSSLLDCLCCLLCLHG